MAVLIAPSGLSLIQGAMKRALGRAASSGEQARALDQWLPEIKDDIWFVEGGSHNILEASALIVLTEGTHIYSLASDFDSPKAFTILDGDGRETAQAGASSTITLVATDSSESAGRIGKEIVLIAGTGSGQKRQITGFNSSTKVATVDSAWATIPNSTTEYLLVSQYQPFHLIEPKSFSKITDRTDRDRPTSGMIWKGQLYVQKVPDKTYVLWYQYWANILKVDGADTSEIHQDMLANSRSLIVQGIFAKTLQNEDDARRNTELLVYNDMITKLTHRSQQSGAVEPYDF